MNLSQQSKRLQQLPLAMAVCAALTACGGSSDNDSSPMDPVEETAAVCLDKAFYTSGNQIAQKFSFPGTSFSAMSVSWQFSDAPATFHGQGGLVVVSESGQPVDYIPSGAGTYTQSTYLSPLSNGEITTHGYVVDSGALQLRAHAEEVYSPPSTDRKFTLKKGESTLYEVKGQRTVTSFMNPTPEVSEVNTSTTVKFIGMEKVTIDNRQVDACKFQFGDGKGQDFSWYYRSVEVQRSGTDGKITKQTSALTLNGQPY